MWLKFFSWRKALIGIVIIKAVLSLAVKPGSSLVSYSGISYFLLLLLAASFAVRNGIRNTLGNRPFWFFLGTGCGVWTLHEYIQLYYELGLHTEVPNNSIADTLVFLHLVPLMAALAIRPHRNLSERRLYRAILNALFLLLFWGFLYAYAVFPYQYLYSTAGYALRFDLLYLLENLALVLAVAFLTLRAEPPWKLVYLHLFGASALYALSSTIANLAADSGGYVNGKLYGLGLTASVCWFVWIPLQARQPVATVVTATRPDDNEASPSPIWAMLAMAMILVPIVWELFERSDNPGLRTLRLLIAVATIVFLASAAYLKEYLARRELGSHVDLANDRLRLAMQNGSWVGWDWDVKSGQDFWFGDLQTIFGIPSDKHVASLEEFIAYVHADDRQRVSAALADARQNSRPYTEEFRILRPDGTIRWLAARGKFYFSPNGAPERMVGVSLDITDRKLAEDKLREYEKAVEGSEEMIAVVDRDYRYLIANRKFLRVRNMTKEQVVGHFAAEVLNEGVFEAEVKDKLDECFQGKVVRFEMKYIYPYLGERDVLISYFPIEGLSGIDRVACIVQDITDRKRLEMVLTGMSRKLIEAQEQERARISRELHDDINQRLALVAVEIEQLLRNPSDSASQLACRLTDLRARVTEVSTEVQSISHQLHSTQLEYLGIAAAMKSFCSEFATRKRVEIRVTHGDIPQPIPADVSLCLFRILQEALQNASKHSNVRHFDVRLFCADHQLHLTVMDRGIGFHVETAMTKGGLGLISMRERVRLVNGTLAINSTLMSGTTIHVSVPLGSAHSARRAPAKGDTLSRPGMNFRDNTV